MQNANSPILAKNRPKIDIEPPPPPAARYPTRKPEPAPKYPQNDNSPESQFKLLSELKISSRANNPNGNNNTRSAILEIKTADVESLKYQYFVMSLPATFSFPILFKKSSLRIYARCNMTPYSILRIPLSIDKVGVNERELQKIEFLVK